MKGRIITIGSFDGVHRGHAALLDRTVKEALARGLVSTVLTFKVPPKIVLDPSTSHELLTDCWEKEILIRAHGIKEVFFLDFNGDISNIKPFRFFREVLFQKLKAKGIVVGSNFRFGLNRSAGPIELVRWGEEFGIPVWVISPVKDQSSVISSSRIRELIHGGQFETFSRLLGHPFLVGGKVVKGRGVGKKMGIATFNMGPKWKALPHGVFVVQGWSLPKSSRGGPQFCRVPKKGFFYGVCNIGTRPTFLKHSPVMVEVHILEGLKRAQKKYLFIRLLRKLRNEKKFSSKMGLIAAITKDIERAQKFVAREKKRMEKSI